MKIRRLAFFLVILLAAAVLTACSHAPAVTIQNEKLTLIDTEMTDRYEGVLPAEGNRILAVRFLAENENPDLTAIAEGFFGSYPCILSAGGNTYDCLSVAFQQKKRTPFCDPPVRSTRLSSGRRRLHAFWRQFFRHRIFNLNFTAKVYSPVRLPRF